ncbi:MAG: protein kinase domain-containing protein [Terriglobales bacterium]
MSLRWLVEGCVLDRLGKYELLGELGRGAMGIVYRARDPIINRRVALKTITTGLSENPQLLERFYREAQSAGGLQHPNIVTVYDMGEASGIPYIAMEFIDGESLEGPISRQDKIPLALKLSWASQACQALDYAHKRGIIHRDIKPANLMVNSQGAVKVVDFGIARVLEASKTQTGMLIGTFAYMSPEQYQGEHADERSDIWSFGVLLYELLTYKRPFEGKTPAAVMHAICHLEPPAISAHIAECPAELQAVMERILMKSPMDRYQSMEDVLLDLDPICKSLQSITVKQWIVEAEQLYQGQQFTEARDRLKQALQVESSNHQARGLLEKVNTELKRVMVRPQVQSHLDKGLALLAEGKLQEAKLEAEACLDLDSRFGPAHDLQRQVSEEMERAQVVAGHLATARQQLAEGAPELVQTILANVFQLDPANTEARQLQEQADRQIYDRKRRAALSQGLQQARGLWTQQEYAGCIEVLTKLQREFPEEDEVVRLLETARDDQAEQLKRQKLATARAMLAAGQFGDCKTELSELRQQFPSDESVVALLDQCQREELNQVRLNGIKEARTFLAARQYAQCESLLARLRQQFPGDEQIPQLMAKVAADAAEEAFQLELASGRKLLAERRYAECNSLLNTLQKRFPDRKEVVEVQNALHQEEAEQRKLKALADIQKLLLEKKYEESLTLLTKLQKDYPDERDEIPKLLETARAGAIEQQKQRKVSEARALMAAEKFSDAATLLDGLQKVDPKDSVIEKLRKLADAEQEKKAKRERLDREWVQLKQLANEKKYPDLLTRTEKLLGDYPDDADLLRLQQFARAQQMQIERETKLRNVLEEFNNLRKNNRLEEALKVAKQGLTEFPGNPQLLSTSEQTEIQLRKQQTRRTIEQRMKEIKVKINREKFSEAVDLAKQTLMTFGPDTGVNQLLNSAQVELEARNKKREEQKKIDVIQQFILSGKLDDASATLVQAIDDGSLIRSDPRVKRAIEEVESRKQAAQSKPVEEPTRVPSAANEYALFQGPPVPLEGPPADALTAQASVEPAVHSKPTSPPPVPMQSAAVPDVRVVEPPKAAPVIPATVPQPKPETPAGRPPGKTSKPAGPPPVIKKPADQPSQHSETVKLSPAHEKHLPEKKEAVLPVWRRPFTLGAGAVILAGVIGLTIYFSGGNKQTPASPSVTTAVAPQPPQRDPLEVEQQHDMDLADKSVAAGKLEQAIKLLQQSAAKNGPLTDVIQKKQQEIEAALKNDDLRKIRQNEATIWQRANADLTAGKLQQASNEFRNILALPEGATRKDEAKRYIDQVIPNREHEEALFADARKAAREKDPASLQQALRLADQVIALNGVRKDDADRLKSDVNDHLSKLEQQRKNQQIANLLASARQSIRSGDLASGRSKADQIRQMGGDGSALVAEIDQAEKMRAADSAFQDAMRRYRQANAGDKGSLEAARAPLQSIASGGGPHASEARNAVDDIGQKLAKLNQPTQPAPVARNPNPPPVSSDSSDRDAIANAVKRYFQAFSDRDANALRSAWPSMSSKQYNGYKTAFENASAIRMQLTSQSIELGADGATATLSTTATQEYTPKGSATKVVTSPYVFKLVKKDGAWVIVDLR